MWDWETILSSFPVKLYFSFKFCETEEKVWNCLKTMQTRVLISHLYSLHFTNTFISFPPYKGYHGTGQGVQRGITGRARGDKGANKAMKIMKNWNHFWFWFFQFWTGKELSLCNKLEFSNPFICTTWQSIPMTFQT